MTLLECIKFWLRISELQSEDLGSLQTYHLYVLGYYSYYPIYRHPSSVSLKRLEENFVSVNIASEALSQFPNSQALSEDTFETSEGEIIVPRPLFLLANFVRGFSVIL